ncbi:MAG: hypothetical protein ACKVOS_03645 [Sphingorhabdus sp.]|uniref:hypothetical protein n=1 Tax=Sphingorhabdus sp. TaxID=1902408 RepID=UPI0038FBE4A3
MSRLFDIYDEMQRAVSAVTGRHLAAMERLGCTAPAIAAIGAKQAPFGVMRCDMRGKQFFEPTSEPYGIDAVIMPVMDEGEIVDLIAWRTLAPSALRWRNGDGWVLGIDAIQEPPLWDGFREITLHATPLDWIRNGGNGAVILDWSAVSQIRKLALFDIIRCDHPNVHQQLSAILSQPERKPKILGTEVKHGRAA